MAKLTAEEREIILNTLVENSIIEEDDREAVGNLTDRKLVEFASATLNSDDDDDDSDDDDDDVVDNADDESEDDEEFEDDEDEDDEELANNQKECTCNGCGGKMKRKGKKAPAMEEDEEEMTGNLTAEEWLASAPPEIAEVVHNAMQFATNEKAKLIETLTANLSGEAKKSMIRKLATNTLDQLKDIATLLPEKAAVSTPSTPGIRRQTIFSGAATPGSVTANTQKKSEPLIPPTINWSEAVKEFSQN